MIAVTTHDERPLRLLDPEASATYGYHRRYGFVSQDSAKTRAELLKRQGRKKVDVRSEDWLCSFAFRAGQPVAISGCTTESIGEGVWRLATAAGDYRLIHQDRLPPVVVPEEEPSSENRVSTVMALLMFLALFGGGYLLTQMEAKQEQEDIAKLEEQQKTVAIPKVKVVVEPPKPVEKKVVEKQPKPKGQLVQQKLGFLALLGKKDLTKAVGGMPSPAERKSPGAGAGGTQGSGGQLLTGLGKGLRKTTVGNTGVAGLGGIGNAGAGGGEGGFGNAYVGSGGPGKGRVLSDVNLAEEIELDGGLDRAVIQATIAKYLSQIRACYERGLRQKPGLTGQVTMDFEVNGDGKLNFAKVRKTTLEHEAVESCISRVMLTWQFPKPVGGTLVKVNYPFMLKPASYM